MANLKFKELNAQELESVNGGGFLVGVAIGVAVYLIISTIENPNAFVDGLLGR